MAIVKTLSPPLTSEWKCIYMYVCAYVKLAVGDIICRNALWQKFSHSILCWLLCLYTCVRVCVCDNLAGKSFCRNCLSQCFSLKVRTHMQAIRRKMPHFICETFIQYIYVCICNCSWYCCCSCGCFFLFLLSLHANVVIEFRLVATQTHTHLHKLMPYGSMSLTYAFARLSFELESSVFVVTNLCNWKSNLKVVGNATCSYVFAGRWNA